MSLDTIFITFKFNLTCTKVLKNNNYEVASIAVNIINRLTKSIKINLSCLKKRLLKGFKVIKIIIEKKKIRRKYQIKGQESLILFLIILGKK